MDSVPSERWVYLPLHHYDITVNGDNDIIMTSWFVYPLIQCSGVLPS